MCISSLNICMLKKHVFKNEEKNKKHMLTYFSLFLFV